MRTLLIAPIALLGLLPCLPASAASFDCSRTSTVFEEAICEDPGLSEADDTLDVAFQTAIGGLTKGAADLMRREQRDWISFTEQSCADDVLPGNDSVETERVDCLKTLYNNRISQLETARMVGGLRFYLVDRFMALPDDSGDSWVKVASKEVSSPRIDGRSKLAKAFNVYMDAETEGYASYFDPDGAAEGVVSDAGPSTDNSAVYTIDAVTDSRISLEANNYWYGHGAAHGNYSISYVHFLREPMRGLEASDVFAAKGWPKALSTIVFNKLQDTWGENLFVDKESDIRESVADPIHWNFSDEGLLVRFQPYEVTAYAAGAVAVTVPWSEIDDLLAETAYSSVIY